MSNGFADKTKMQFTNALERQVTERLAKIEQEDADRCSSCGGEDCICCEIYHDRNKWVSPEELFSEFDGFDFDYEDDEEE